jgi:hypothetical protein
MTSDPPRQPAPMEEVQCHQAPIVCRHRTSEERCQAPFFELLSTVPDFPMQWDGAQ